MGIETASGAEYRPITEEYKSDFVISYLELRRTIGIVGMSLPFILVGGAWLFFSIRPQISLSAYHNTPMRDLSVGLFFFLAGFCGRTGDMTGGMRSPGNWHPCLAGFLPSSLCPKVR
jgi:hypothetical protein